MNSQGNNLTKRITIITAVLLTVTFISAFIIDLAPKIRKESVVKGISEYKTEIVNPGSESEFRFNYLRSEFDSVIFFVMSGNASDLTVSIADAENGTEFVKNVRIAEDNCIPEGKAIAVRLKHGHNENFSPGNYLVTLRNGSNTPVGVATGKNDSNLTVRLLKNTTTANPVALIVCVLLFGYAALNLYFFLKNGLTPPPSPEKLFLLTAIPICAAFIVLLPPWSTGDSEAHYLACYRMSNLFLGQGSNGQWLGRADDVAFYRDIWWNSTPPSTGGYEILKSNFSLFATDKTLIQMSSTSEKMNYYSAFCYIPQTFALVIGRLIGLSPIANCYLVKVFTAAFYIIFCHQAIKSTPFGKGIISLCAILPSSLMMSGAFSYDSMVIISTLNFISSVLLLKTDPDNRKALFYTCVSAFVLGAVKGGGYLILLPLIIIVPNCKKGMKILSKLLPLISGIISVFLFDVIFPDNALFQFGSKGNGFMTASFATERPFEYLIMTVKTYGRFAVDMISDLFGSKLCWGENTIPVLFSFVMILVLIMISASDKSVDSLHTKDLLTASAVVVIALLTTPAMLLSWTPEGSDVILGIQGHYFLPVLPLFALVAGKGIRSLSKKTGIEKSKAAKISVILPYPLVVILMFFAFYFILRLYLSR